jgi:iron-sulfur cluster assembly protein
MMLTEAAAERIKAIMAAKGTNVVGPRIGVKKGGCAGMEYTMALSTGQGRSTRWSRTRSPCPVDPKAVFYLLGTEMDYRVDRLARFVFNNPNQKIAGSPSISSGGEAKTRGAEILSARLAVRSESLRAF